MLSGGFLKTLLKDTRTKHVSKLLWAFFSVFLLMQRKTLCHIYPSKVPTLIHLIKGENLWWMPLRWLPDGSQMPPQMPNASQMSSKCLPDVPKITDVSQMSPSCLPDASQMSASQMF